MKHVSTLAPPSKGNFGFESGQLASGASMASSVEKTICAGPAIGC